MVRVIDRAGATPGRNSTLREWQARCNADAAHRGRSQAATILLAARARAREIIAAAEDQAAALVEAERQQAWEAGSAQGLSQAQAEMAPSLQRLAEIAASAAVDHDESLGNLDQEIVTLAMAVARAVVRREVAISAESVLDTVRAALQEMTLSASVQFHVHPEDQTILLSNLPMLSLPPTIRATVVADSTMSRGGCMIESGACRVDGTIEKQLDHLEDLLRERIHAA